MKKTVLLLVVVLALGATVVPTLATPPEELTSLADYFDADTPVFLSFRTDGAFIDELDALIERIRDGLPRGTVPPFSLREELDRSLTQPFGEDATFENTFGTWLGDTASVGILSLDGMMGRGMGGEESPVLVAIDITDREAAEDFVEQVVDMGMALERDTDGDWTTYLPEEDFVNTAIAIGDDVMFIGTSEDVLPLSGDIRSLANDETFAADIDRLPADDYSWVARLNLGDFLSEMMSVVEAMGGMDDMPPGFESFMAIYDNYPTQAMGFTVLDERSLTFDFAQAPLDFGAVFEGTPFADMMPTGYEPVDLSFAEHVPADAPLMIQGSNFGYSVDVSIETLAWLAEFGMQMNMKNGRMDDDVPAFVQNLDAGDIRAFIDLGFAGLTGLDLREEVLPLLNGNAAMFLRVLPAETINYTIDLGLAFEVTDAAGTQALYDALLNSLAEYEANFSEEGNTIVLPDVIRGFFPVDAQASLEDPRLDFLIGLSDDVFAFGSRDAVDFAVNGGDGSLADDPAFQDAQQFFLPGAVSVAYVGFEPISDLLDSVGGMMGRSAQAFGSDLEDAQLLLGLFSSASITATMDEDFSTTARFVLTLSE